jgi:hypothetical protein
MNQRFNDISLQRGPSDTGRAEVIGPRFVSQTPKKKLVKFQFKQCYRGESINLTKEQKAAEIRIQQLEKQNNINVYIWCC